MNVRDVTIVSDDTQPVVVETVHPLTQEPAFGAPVGEPVVVTEIPARETVQVRSSMTISPAAVVAGIAAVALMLFGAINLARAGIDGTWREPVVQVAGFEGTALLGLISLVAGIALLAAAFSRDRGAILFVSIVIGVAGATLAIEPTVGGDLIASESSFGVAVLIVSAFVAFVAAVAPSVRRTSNRLERL
jgi:hypothetical protein